MVNLSSKPVGPSVMLFNSYFVGNPDFLNSNWKVSNRERNLKVRSKNGIFYCSKRRNKIAGVVAKNGEQQSLVLELKRQLRRRRLGLFLLGRRLFGVAVCRGSGFSFVGVFGNSDLLRFDLLSTEFRIATHDAFRQNSLPETTDAATRLRGRFFHLGGIAFLGRPLEGNFRRHSLRRIRSAISFLDLGALPQKIESCPRVAAVGQLFNVGKRVLSVPPRVVRVIGNATWRSVTGPTAAALESRHVRSARNGKSVRILDPENAFAASVVGRLRRLALTPGSVFAVRFPVRLGF